jgi:hypothetical protein
MTKAKGIMQKKHWTWKEVRKAAIVFFLVLCIVSIPFYFIGENGYNYVSICNKKKRVEAEPENTIDVLYAGDSETWAAFGPLQMYHEQGCKRRADRATQSGGSEPLSVFLRASNSGSIEPPCLGWLVPYLFLVFSH